MERLGLVYVAMSRWRSGGRLFVVFLLLLAGVSAVILSVPDRYALSVGFGILAVGMFAYAARLVSQSLRGRAGR